LKIALSFSPKSPLFTAFLKNHSKNLSLYPSNIKSNGGIKMMEMEKTVNTRKLMDIAECAEYLGVSARTVYNWVSQRAIPFIKVHGKLVRFRLTDIENWLCCNPDPVPPAPAQKPAKPPQKPAKGNNGTGKGNGKGAHGETITETISRILHNN
jgi:excisionase family DNA binding protein